ncbi:MAG: formate dehydrogenase accessory sulfurtransferase FdhD [Pseudomonadota bacterium]
MSVPARDVGFSRLYRGGASREARAVAIEAPIALEFNGFALAVMLATPDRIEDFCVGFAIAEGLLTPGAGAPSVAVSQTPLGYVARVQLPTASDALIARRIRTRVSEGSCGLCGIESLETLAALPPTPTAPLHLSFDTILRAANALSAHQALGQATGATHAAALANPAGTIALVAEDVGRHNALDKAIGARQRLGLEGDYFALSTARASFELVEKAARANLGALVTLSAPTTFAVDRAAAVGLPLYSLARGDSVLRLDSEALGP